MSFISQCLQNNNGEEMVGWQEIDAIKIMTMWKWIVVHEVVDYCSSDGKLFIS